MSSAVEQHAGGQVLFALAVCRLAQVVVGIVVAGYGLGLSAPLLHQISSVSIRAMAEKEFAILFLSFEQF